MSTPLYNLIRPHFKTLKGYVSAGMEMKKTEEKIFLNANENPYELPGLETFNHYPEPQPTDLLKDYAKLYGVDESKIVMTRGADEGIVILTTLFCEPHKDAVLICPPTFGMYARSAGVSPVPTHEVALIEESGTFKLDVEGIIAGAQHVKMIYLCSPNNPTGTSFAREDILRICKETEGKAAVILDETYAEFSEAGSLAHKLNDVPNLIILRTLSKSYAMAGQRMGSILCADANVTETLKAKILDAYPLPVASVNAALKVMQPDVQKIAQENIEKILSERDRIREAFEASPLVEYVYPSDANFLLIKMQRAHEFWEFCAQNNVVLRDFSNKPATQNCIRINPGLPQHNDLLIGLLEQFKTQV